MAVRDPRNRRHQAGAEQHDRDQPRRVRLQRQVRQVEQQPRLADHVGRIHVVLERLGVDLRLRLLRPFLSRDEPLLQFAYAREIFIEFLPVPRAESRLQLPRLVADPVEDALAVAQPADLGLHFVRLPFEEQPRKDRRRPAVRRHQRPAPRPRQAEPFGRQREAGEPRQPADLLGRKLVDRDAVLESGPQFRMRRGREEAEDRVVAGFDVRVRQAGDDREVCAVVLEDLEVGGEFVVPAGLCRVQVGCVQAEWCADADHATGDAGVHFARAHVSKAVQQRQGERNAGCSEKRAAARARRRDGGTEGRRDRRSADSHGRLQAFEFRDMFTSMPMMSSYSV